MEPNSGKFFTSQFTKAHVLLEADEPPMLAKCQGQCNRHTSVLYLVYRALACAWWLSILCATFTELSGMYFLFLTNWGVIILFISTTLQLASAIYQYAKEKRDDARGIMKKTPLLYKISWVIYNIASVLAFVITLVYYTAIGGGPHFLDVAVHALTTVYVIADAYVTGIPVRLLHFWHTALFLVVYLSATVLYWAATGEGIYEITDYGENPDISATAVLLIIIVGVPVLHTVLFFMYWTRVLLWTYCCNQGKDSNRHGDSINNSGMTYQTNNSISKTGFENSAFRHETPV